jgi:hypothetical protein
MGTGGFLKLRMLASVAVVTAGLVTASTAQAARLQSYQQATNEFTSPGVGQTSGTATCPAGTELVGGGASLDSTPALSTEIVSSYPSADGTTWTGTLENQVNAGTDLYVRAICAAGVSDYSVVAGALVHNPTGQHTAATATCPSGTVALGGGAHLSSTNLGVSLSDDHPTAQGASWVVHANNVSGAGDQITPYVICGTKPTGYAIAVGPSTAVGASSSGESTAICPSGSSVLSGGGNLNAAPTSVDLNGTTASGNNAWTASVSDTAAATSIISARAVCATFK